MRPLLFLFLLLGVSIFATAAQPTPKPDGPIKLPVTPIVPQPMPATVDPEPVTTLPADTLYVIESKVRCVVRAHPTGLVKVSEKTGPRDFTAKFAGGTGSIEDKSFAGPFLYVVRASGIGRVELDVIPAGFETAAQIVSVTLSVDDGSKPIPPPIPPKPQPDDPAKPAAPTKLYIVVVEETADAAAASRGALIFDAALAARTTSQGHHWRIVDKDVIDKDGKPPADVARFLDASKGKVLPQLFLVNPDGDTLFSGPLPKTAADVLAQIKKVGG